MGIMVPCWHTQGRHAMEQSAEAHPPFGPAQRMAEKIAPRHTILMSYT